MSGHTQGPWEALPWERENGGTDWNVWGPQPSNHPADHALQGDFGSEAEARIIAAVRESHEANKASLMVLCAIRDAQSWHENMLKDIDFAIEANRAAIAKATGAAP
jgi:hypothetical protein